MGCNNSRNIEAVIPLRLNSDGSEMDDSQEDRDMIFVKRRTWGSPVPPLPAIPTKPSKESLEPSPRSDGEHFVAETDFHASKGGAAFTLQEKPAKEAPANPSRPRRLKPLADGRRTMTREDLLRREQEHHRRREEKMRQRTEKLAHKKSVNKRRTMDENRFEEAQKIFAQSEARLNQVSRNRENALRTKVLKAREHNAKIKKVMRRDNNSNNNNQNWNGEMENDADYNRSADGESWDDSEEYGNIYDKMEYIPTTTFPVKPAALAAEVAAVVVGPGGTGPAQTDEDFFD